MGKNAIPVLIALFAQIPFFSVLSATASKSVENGWHALSGTISTDHGVLRLHPAEPSTEAALFLDETEVFSEGGASVRFRILPVATDPQSNPSSSTVSVLGAEIIFLEEDGERGRIVVIDGDVGIKTSFDFDVLPTGESGHWIHIIVRREFSPEEDSSSWRLTVDGEEIDSTFRTSDSLSALGLVQFVGHPTYDTYVGTIESKTSDGWTAVSGGFAEDAEDADSRGAYSSSEIALSDWEGISVDTHNKDQTKTGLRADIDRLYVFVCAVSGSDANDGLSAKSLNESGPLRSIEAAMHQVPSGGTIHLAEGEYSNPRTIRLDRKSVTIQPEGSVVFK